MRLASTPSSCPVVNVANTRLDFEQSDLRPQKRDDKRQECDDRPHQRLADEDPAVDDVLDGLDGVGGMARILLGSAGPKGSLPVKSFLSAGVHRAVSWRAGLSV